MRIFPNRIFVIRPPKFEYTGRISNMRILSNHIFDICPLKVEYTGLTSNIHEYIRIYMAEYRIYKRCAILNKQK